MFRASLAASALLLLSAQTFAADNGIYLGGSLGQAGTEFNDSELDLSFKGHDTGFKVIGGFRPLDFLGFELNYVDLGKPDDTVDSVKIESKAHGISGFAVGFLPLPFMDLFAKVGAVSWNAKVSFPELQESAKENGTDLAYGVGGQVRFGSLAARLEYERFEIEDLDKVDLISVGLTWTFL